MSDRRFALPGPRLRNINLRNPRLSRAVTFGQRLLAAMGFNRREAQQPGRVPTASELLEIIAAKREAERRLTTDFRNSQHSRHGPDSQLLRAPTAQDILSAIDARRVADLNRGPRSRR